MAGIGFSLRKILKHDTLTRITTAYCVAGLISGGPWLLSIFCILLLSLLIAVFPAYHTILGQFQTSVTYLIAGSLILSGLAGDSFSRYVADQLFLKRVEYVISNLNGLIFLLSTLAGVLSFVFVLFLFPHQSLLYRLFFMGSFVVLCNIWVHISLLTGLKDYKIILVAFFAGYGALVVLAYGLRHWGLDAFMGSFLFCQLTLLGILQVALYREYPTNSIIAFHFLKEKQVFKILIASGFLYNLAIWTDKFVFWFSPQTSYPVIGPLRASLVYDLPIFIAYLLSLPGMAVFLLLIETNFADYYLHFHSSIRNGKPLSYIKASGEQMIGYALNVIYSIVKIQAITIIIVYEAGGFLLSLLHVPLIYNQLLFIAVIGTSFQVVLLAIINILHYMDRLRDVFCLSLLFFVLNLVFTSISVYEGPFYYGFGFTCALIVTCTVGMYLLNREFTDIEYKVVMLR